MAFISARGGIHAVPSLSTDPEFAPFLMLFPSDVKGKLELSHGAQRASNMLPRRIPDRAPEKYQEKPFDNDRES